jgi:hypothetical protein
VFFASLSTAQAVSVVWQMVASPWTVGTLNLGNVAAIDCELTREPLQAVNLSDNPTDCTRMVCTCQTVPAFAIVSILTNPELGPSTHESKINMLVVPE